MKIFICCDITESAFDVYVSWTAVGALGFVLGLLLLLVLDFEVTVEFVNLVYGFATEGHDELLGFL